VYQLAKLPLDVLRHGHSPRALAGGLAERIRFARRGTFPTRYLPARRTGLPDDTVDEQAQEPRPVLSPTPR